MKIIAIGKSHDKNLAEAIKDYQKRLKKPFALEWVFLPHSLWSGARATEEESGRIFKRLAANDYVILLDERGSELTSPELSKKLDGLFAHGKSVVLVIGGAYGASLDLRKRANFTWSLSPLVFPHQLVRLILTEQIYRAQTIARGEPYHHE